MSCVKFVFTVCSTPTFLTCKVWRRNGDKHFPAKSFGVTPGVFFVISVAVPSILELSGHANLPVLPVLKCHLPLAECTWVPHLPSISLLLNSCISATRVLNSRQLFGNYCLQYWAAKCRTTLLLK